MSENETIVREDSGSQSSNGSKIQIGDIFYESWGYDQTQNDFVQVVSISPTGKSVMVRMMAARSVTPNTVAPTIQHGQPFRMLVDRDYHGEPGIKGSYPFCWSQVEDDPKTWSRRLGYFSKYTDPVYETPAGYGH